MSSRCDSHYHHLPCIQTRAGGGPSNASATTTTSLAFKRELEVVFFVLPTPLPPPPPPSHPNASQRWFFSSFRRLRPTTTFLAFKREPEVVLFVVSTCFPPPPPPSCLNTSRRRSISSFRHASHHHHLPHFETRARGGSFRRFDVPPTTTTSLASKCELEVVLFGGFKASTAAATSSLPTNR